MELVESFFKNDEGHNVTVNGDRYRAMITSFFIPEFNNHDVQELWFQQESATCHTARATIDLLKDTFGDRLISRFGPVNWPPRFCDLTPLDYFLWGYVKSLVYADKPETLDHLEDNIRRVIADIRPQMLEKFYISKKTPFTYTDVKRQEKRNTTLQNNAIVESLAIYLEGSNSPNRWLRATKCSPETDRKWYKNCVWIEAQWLSGSVPHFYATVSFRRITKRRVWFLSREGANTKGREIFLDVLEMTVNFGRQVCLHRESWGSRRYANRSALSQQGGYILPLGEVWALWKKSSNRLPIEQMTDDRK
ncbi:uncharacterized protein TNCV_1458131 [Trichonephila clavipes]|nr:uncharacterized protein TNCV_1458131 [Trichonephila clavipes]